MEGVVIAIVVATALSAGAIMIGPALGFVDLPDDELKTHDRPAVPLGGFGIFLAVHTGLVVADVYDPRLALASGMVLVLGLVDDRVGVSPLPRLVIQGGAGVVLGWSTGASLYEVVVVTGLVVVAINAVNLFDGLDGLAGLSAAVAAVGLGLLAAVRGADPLAGYVVAAALTGFLLFNWHPARVFLGDNGAYVTGIFLAYLIVSPGLGGGPDVVISAAVLGVFLIDLVVTVLRRRLSGRPLFGGDRSHIYDQLHLRGWGIRKVALASGLAQAFFVGLAFAVASAGWAWLGAAAVVGVGLASLAALWRAGFVQADA